MQIRPWEQLSETRRGWAVGSILGLFFSVLYLYSLFLSVHTFGENYTFSLIIIPAIPGAFVSEQFLMLLQTETLHLHRLTARLVFVGICGLSNYLFWGSYFSLFYKMSHAKISNANTVLAISFVNFFFSVIGLSYSINRGVDLHEFSPLLLILFLSLMWAMFSLGSIFSCLFSHEISRNLPSG